MIFKKGFWWFPELKIKEIIERKSVRLGDHSTQVLMLSTKKLFVESKSGKIDVPKEELENHLRMIYSDHLNGIPIPSVRDLSKPQDPTVMFNVMKLGEVRDFVYKARADSALGMNGISYKWYKNCPYVLRKIIVLLQQVRKKGIVSQK